MPGEVSLAHRGVLFLDELAEFPRNALESLRQPLEEGSILVSRVGRSVRMPSRFALVAAMNPCRCGYLGAEARACSCSPGAVKRYQSRVSGPLIDRIDLQVYVRALTGEQMLSPAHAEPSSAVRARVVRARELQEKRFSGTSFSHGRVNAAMSPREVLQFCELSPKGQRSLRRAVDSLGLSARAFDRILKVARTIADLEGESAIKESHLQEAIEFRSLESELFLE
jgi:magnesium chelatase family protein